jgi:hypothetical protein
MQRPPMALLLLLLVVNLPSIMPFLIPISSSPYCFARRGGGVGTGSFLHINKQCPTLRKRTGPNIGVRFLKAKVRPEILDAAAIEIIDEVLRENKPAEPLLKKTVSKGRDAFTKLSA